MKVMHMLGAMPLQVAHAGRQRRRASPAARARDAA